MLSCCAISNLISRQHYRNFNNTDNTKRKSVQYLPSWSYRLQSAPDASNRSTNSTFLQFHDQTRTMTWETSCYSNDSDSPHPRWAQIVQ